MKLFLDPLFDLAAAGLAYVVLGLIWSWVSWRCGRCGQAFIPFNLTDKYIGKWWFGVICGDCMDKEFRINRGRLELRRWKQHQKEKP